MLHDSISSGHSFRPASRYLRFAAMAIILPSLACRGDSGSHGADTPAQGAQPAAQQAPTTPGPSGPIDQPLAERGEALFQAKGCSGCHTVGGGRLTGPDLAGVTERRDFGWIVAMITKPDSMIKADSTARQLFAEYMTPMLNLGVTREEARAVYEYLRGEAKGDS